MIAYILAEDPTLSNDRKQINAWEWYHWIGLDKDINCYRFLKYYFWSWIFEKSSKFWAASCKNESNILPVRIRVCIESFLPIGCCTFIWWKNPPMCGSISVWLQDVGILYSRAVIQRTIDVSPAFLEHGRKTGFQTKQAGGWIHFCMKWLRTLNSYQIFKIKKNISKTYSSWCPYQGLSNGTTLMQIQSGWMVPLMIDVDGELKRVKSCARKMANFSNCKGNRAGEREKCIKS